MPRLGTSASRAILYGMTDTPPPQPPIDPRLAGWVARAAQAGWGGALLALLDVIEPIGVFGAGLLDVAQPAARLLGDRAGALTALARQLESRDGAAQLRQLIETYDDNTAPPRE